MRFWPSSLGLFARARSRSLLPVGLLSGLLLQDGWGNGRGIGAPSCLAPSQACGAELCAELGDGEMVPDGLRSRPLARADRISQGALECVTFLPRLVVLLAKILALTRGFSSNLAVVAAEVLYF